MKVAMKCVIILSMVFLILEVPTKSYKEKNNELNNSLDKILLVMQFLNKHTMVRGSAEVQTDYHHIPSECSSRYTKELSTRDVNRCRFSMKNYLSTASCLKILYIMVSMESPVNCRAADAIVDVV